MEEAATFHWRGYVIALILDSESRVRVLPVEDARARWEFAPLWSILFLWLDGAWVLFLPSARGLYCCSVTPRVLTLTAQVLASMCPTWAAIPRQHIIYRLYHLLGFRITKLIHIPLMTEAGPNVYLGVCSLLKSEGSHVFPVAVNG